MTYEQQIQKLRDKNLTITDENEAKSILQQDGYYALITGYKDLFKNPSTKNYRDGTTLQDILALYQFDDQQISHDGCFVLWDSHKIGKNLLLTEKYKPLKKPFILALQKMKSFFISLHQNPPALSNFFTSHFADFFHKVYPARQ